MISASSQTLAALIASNPLLIGRESISFEHPSLARSQRPCLNVYCYHIQASSSESRSLLESGSQWFELTFLLSVFDHTSLGEQHLFAAVLSALSRRDVVPEQQLAPSLRGWGDLPLQVSTRDAADELQLWTALGAPVRLSLHVTLTVPACTSPRLVTAA